MMMNTNGPQTDRPGDLSEYLSEHDRLITRHESERIVQKIWELDPAGIDSTTISVVGWWQGELRWARNRVTLAGDRRDVHVRIGRVIEGRMGIGRTNQTDDASLMGVLRMAERAALLRNGRSWEDFREDKPLLESPETAIWSDGTYNVTSAATAALAQQLTDTAETHDLIAAGYIEVRGASSASVNPESASGRSIIYNRLTQSQCSMTVRHPKGIGSGWAGLSSYDWKAIDAPVLAQRALDKCLASLNPVAIEPGRYTTILEPQAVAQLLSPMVLAPLQSRERMEAPGGPFSLDYDPSIGLWRTKLGLKVLDERITIEHDPADPILGVVPSAGMTKATWIKDGVLIALGMMRPYTLAKLNENVGLEYRPGYRMSGGSTSMDEMIATTKRGILATRFSGESVLDKQSLLMTGLTRDGLWLIENGKIVKAIKNFRWIESPLFAFNQVEQLGTPVAVFNPEKNPYRFQVMPVVVPPVKVNDFSFTALVDAV